MNIICESCKHKRESDNICHHGYNQMHGRKDSKKGKTIICERFSKYLKKMGLVEW